MSEYREFEGNYAKPADSGYGCPQPREMDGGRSKRIKRALRSHRNYTRSRQKSRQGLGKRRYR